MPHATARLTRLLALSLACVALALAGCSAARDAAPRAATDGRPVPQVRRVVIISVDGLRPDLLLRASTPHMHRLLDAGSFTFWARTVAMCDTLPAHASMLTGVSVEKHGISWNRHIEESYANVPTLFERAVQAGYTTALLSGKTKFVALCKPGTLTWSFVPTDEPNTDESVAVRAAAVIRDHRPDVLFVHLANTDETGHACGWGSPEQMQTIAEADHAAGTILGAIQSAGVADTTCVILTADHGGRGYFHLPNDARSLHIPWIIAGPGIRRNFDLTRFYRRQINIEDTFATACMLLAIPYGADVEGKPVRECLAATAIPPRPLDEADPDPLPAH